VAFAGEKDIGVARVCSLVTRVHLHVVTGQWSAAVADAALVAGDPLASEIAQQVLLTATGLMRARRGDPSAWDALDASLAIARRANEAERLVPVAAARAELAWLEGDAARARAEVEDVLALAVRIGRAWYIGELAIWAVRGGAAPPTGVPIAHPYALQLAGDWRGAAAEFTRLGCHYDAALACYEGDDQDALKDALAALVRMDARPAAARIRRRLAELGARGIQRGPRSARREHPFDLTAREQDVLEALALGLSNAEIGSRLFVSPKTVDHHVSAILAKLDVPTRVAAVAEARKHGLLDPVPVGQDEPGPSATGPRRRS
ncbi:MAG TPA: response regulator transcription factor, partial [Kofleriaceae bacterium]|nr:response regulator transcription factor [Kofleriaceae bacterium]